MKQTFDNSSGTTKFPPLSVLKEVGSGVWGTIARSDAYHASSDASLFSSSLPVLPHEKLNLNGVRLGHQSIHDISSGLRKDHQDVEGGDSIEDNANSVTGGFLPDDEEELLAGIMDDFDLSGLPSSLEDLEDYDLFDSGGGMELENSTQESLRISMSKISLSDGVVGNGLPHYGLPNGVGTVSGEHPYGEHPSRTLFVRNINSNVEDSELRALFEQYGDIRTLYTACKHRGFVMISYYDIRAARTAMRSLQYKPLRRRKLDIHFSIPKDNPSDKDLNQGTLVVFNLDPSVSNEDLRQIFGAYGEVKEIRETPHKRHHKFIEFYDVRAAEAALKSLNRSDIAGKRIKLEPSRPGGARRNFTSDSIKAFGTTTSLMLQLNQELEQDESRILQHPIGSPITNSPPGNWGQFSSPIEPNSLQTISKSPVYRNISPTTSSSPGLASILHSPVSNSVKVAPIGKDQGRGSHMEHVFTNGAAFPQSHSFPEPNLGQHQGTISSFGTSTSNGPGMETLSGSQFLWGSPNRFSEHVSSSAWPTPSMGLPYSSNGKNHGFPYSSRQGSFLGSSHHHHHHHVGSAPSGVPLERRFGFFSESLETSFMNPVAFRGMGIGQNDGSFMVNHLGPCATVNPGITIPRNISENGSSSYRMMSSPRLSPVFVSSGPYPGLTPTNMEGLTDCGRSRRVENNGSQIDTKKQFLLDLEKIKTGEDTRATLMIKNIPNKYTSKMLLAAIDENHKGTYDFLYLPIDFKAFNGKKWEKFNSEKVASLAYARIQGKAALVAHFQNSSLMNEDKRCRPIMFHLEGPDAGDQIIQEHINSNSLSIEVRQPNESQAGDSSESPTKDESGSKPEKS